MKSQLAPQPGSVAFMAAWILLKTQLDIVEGMTRAITDILWRATSDCEPGAAVMSGWFTTACLLQRWSGE